MSVRNKPNYGIYTISLANAGSMELLIIATRVEFITALSGATFTSVAGVNVLTGGTVAPATIVNVQIGKALGDPVPLSINGKINVDQAFDYVRLSWGAQGGVTAFILIDDDSQGAGVFVDAPAAILGGSVALVQGGNTAVITSTLPQLAGLGGALQVDETKAPTPLGASFVTAAPGAVGVTAFLAAATNTKGAWLRSAQGAGNASTGQLYCDTAAPTGTNDLTKRMILDLGAVAQSQNLPYPLFLPAGVGIFFAVAAAGPIISVTWDLVQ